MKRLAKHPPVASKKPKLGEEETHECAICGSESDSTFDIFRYGDWMQSHGLRVHYFCLLLSTNLPQNGTDQSGILGFLIRDIRREISAAQKRICTFCGKSRATIACRKCKEYFHLTCGTRNLCLFQFYGEFPSFCNECITLDEFQAKTLRSPPSSNERCHICKETLGAYIPVRHVYGPCCQHGFVHISCMQKYATSAGYYLKCIWCKSDNFRDLVRRQGVFVPDRDAQWERMKGAYRDLVGGHQRCDVVDCLCPKGRDYVKGKWSLILCDLCGSFGAHNPTCVSRCLRAKTKYKTFKCPTCSGAVSAALARGPLSASQDDKINASVYMKKRPTTFQEPVALSQDTISTPSSHTAVPQVPPMTSVDSRILPLQTPHFSAALLSTPPPVVSPMSSPNRDRETPSCSAAFGVRLQATCDTIWNPNDYETEGPRGEAFRTEAPRGEDYGTDSFEADFQGEDPVIEVAPSDFGTPVLFSPFHSPSPSIIYESPEVSVIDLLSPSPTGEDHEISKPPLYTPLRRIKDERHSPVPTQCPPSEVIPAVTTPPPLHMEPMATDVTPEKVQPSIDLGAPIEPSESPEKAPSPTLMEPSEPPEKAPSPTPMEPSEPPEKAPSPTPMEPSEPPEKAPSPTPMEPSEPPEKAPSPTPMETDVFEGGASDETHCEEATPSPVISSESLPRASSPKVERRVQIEMFEFTKDPVKCIGSVVVSIDLNEPRFQGVSEEELHTNFAHFTEEDVIERTPDVGIFGLLDEIIARHQAEGVWPDFGDSSDSD